MAFQLLKHLQRLSKKGTHACTRSHRSGSRTSGRAFHPAFALTIGAFLSLGLGGCSLSMFGSGQDEAVRNSTGYREVNNSCAGLDLSGTTLDVAGFRGLLRCFNSNGALDALDRLVTAMPDEQLEPIVTTLNESVLRNKTLLYKLETNHQILSERGLLDETLQQLGKLLENDEFVASSIRLLKEGYFSGGSGGARSRTPDRELLAALEKIAAKLATENVEEGLDAALTLATSRSYQELQKRFKGPSPSGRSLRKITDGALEHLRDFNDGEHVLVGRELIRSLITGDLYTGLDQVVGTSSADLKRGIPRLSAVLRSAFADEGRLFDGLTSLFHFAKKPLWCVNGGATVENPALFILGELSRVKPENAASFLKRDNPLQLATMSPMCRFPEQLGANYPALMTLADTNAIRPATELIQAYYAIERGGDRPMARLLVNLLADTGSGTYAGAPAEDTAGIKRLTPLLAELNDRDAWDDLLLTANLVDFKYRQKLAEYLVFLVTPAPELGGKSIYDVFTNVLLRTRSDDLYDFVHSLRHFTDTEEPLLAPALTRLRSAYYANDAHPLIDLAQTVLSGASKNERFFSTLFLMSEMPEFRDSIRLISEMSKDGRMKTLLGNLLAVFHKAAQEGAVPVMATEEPAFVPKRRHDLSSADLIPFEIAPEPSSANKACLKIDLGIDLGQYTHPKHEEQLRNVLSCMNSAGAHDDLEKALEFLNDTKMPDGRSALAYQIDLVRKLNLSPRESKTLIRTWKGEYDSGRFHELLKAVPYLFSKKDEPGQPAISELVLKALAPLVAGGGEGIDTLDRLAKFGATVLRDREFPAVLGFVDRLIPPEKPREQTTAGVEGRKPHLPEEDADAIADAVGKLECEKDPVKRANRAKAILSDYRHSITSWELLQGGQRRAWKREDFDAKAGPIISKLADPDQSAPGKHIVSALLDFMKFYSLPEGATADGERHAPPEYLGKWLKDRSEDYQLIPYFFTDERGKIQYRLRLVNSLDRFELVLINSDFVAPILGKNFGMQFLAQIGQAWGDEDEKNWPPEIRKQFQGRKKRPQTLREAFNDIAKTQKQFEKLMGFPDTPKCKAARLAADGTETGIEPEIETESFLDGLTGDGKKQIQASLFNIRQVLAVLEQNLPGSKHPVFDGGMKVFRDLFYEIHYSTPEKFRGAGDGARNNLSFVMWVSRMGAARQLGRLFFDDRAGESELRDFMAGIVEGATSPGIEPALKTLLAEPKQELIWKTLHLVLDLKNPDTLQTTQSTLFHAVASSHQLGIIPSAVALFPPITEQHRDVLTDQIGWGMELLGTPRVAGFLRNLYLSQDEKKPELQRLLLTVFEEPRLTLDAFSLVKTVSSSPDSREAWNGAWDRLKKLKAIPEYPYDTVKGVWKDLIRFVSEGTSTPDQPPPSPEARELSAKLRRYLADRLDDGELLALLRLALENPVKFNQLLESLSRHTENGDLEEFLAVVRRGL